MLRFVGARARLCDGVTRREVLRIGGLGALSLWGRNYLDLPVGPWDLGATLLHLAGFNPKTEVFDPMQNRMRAICAGAVMQGLV